MTTPRSSTLAVLIASVLREMRLTPERLELLLCRLAQVEAACTPISGRRIPPGTAAEIRKRIGH